MEINNVNDASTKIDRKTVERNRRIRMKGLIHELTSLVPPQHFVPSKELLSQRDQIDQVAAYIMQLRERVENLKKSKELVKSKIETKGTKSRNSAIPGSSIPIVKIREIGSNLEVVLVTGSRKNFALHEVILVLEEQGVEVVSISISTMDDKICHILHAQVKVSRLGVDTSTIYDKLQKLFNYDT
ncbi:transcription factor bHLH162-like [Coffea eugenioides]|uniref:Transcription factor bHLH162-like n=1 Tax=Coffea arabica TaxID=13443 RepID=A0ABM4U6D1_COFAR|nr:transcription factor bHLH162-like [Coffea eugenioides]